MSIISNIMAHATWNLAVLLLCAAMVSLAAAAQDNVAATDNRKADFDYFYLVRQWPATFCNDHYCSHRPPRKYAFTVHGLWPQRRDGTWPEFCDSGSELDIDDIEDLLPDLDRAWPSWSTDDETFWNHEWTRHGTCAEGVIGMQHAFFKAVLKLHADLNIQDALSKHGIVPSNHAQYHVQALMHAIDDMYDVMPHITCDEKGQLAEVWMCINKKLRPIDCVEGPHPHSRVSSPGSKVPSNANCNLIKIPQLVYQSENVEPTGYSKTDVPQQDGITQINLGDLMHVASVQESQSSAVSVAAALQQQQQQLPLLITVGVLVAVALVVAMAVMVQLVQYVNVAVVPGTAGEAGCGSSSSRGDVHAPLLQRVHGEASV